VEKTLLPPLPVIREQLARNQRERHRLRTLLRWAIDDMETGLGGSGDPRSKPVERREPAPVPGRQELAGAVG
jgi:hypothetical protein